MSLASDANREKSRMNAAFVLAVVAVFLVVAGLGVWLWSDSPRAVKLSSIAITSSGDPVQPAGYVGRQACAECHPGETAMHSRSGHSQTLKPAAQTKIGRWLAGQVIEDPGIKGVTWTYAIKNGQLEAVRNDHGKTWKETVGYAVGSGHSGVTYVSLHGAPGMLTGRKHRLSYFTDEHKIKVTPGGDPAGKTDTLLGEPVSTESVLKCFECHSSRISSSGSKVLDPVTMLANIDCERCHGPGAEHVAAMRRGGAEKTAIRYGAGKSGAEAEIRLCGECHRHPSEFPPDALVLENPVLPQFPAAGLTLSKCFQQTPLGISCSACHNPHARTSKDLARYDQVCKNCHDSPGASTCSVSTAKGCVECHMPKRTVPDGFTFYDHWIRIDKPSVKAGGGEAVPATDPAAN